MDKLVVKPNLDVVFKAIFARNEDLLRDFLSLVLDNKPEDYENITILNPEILPEQYNEKFPRLDLILKMQNGEKINIEMQNHDEHDYRQRSVYNQSRLFTRDLKRGDEYDDLTKTICINVLQIPLFESENYKSTVYPVIIETNEIVTELWEIIYFETPKLPDKPGTRLEQWLKFFTINTEEEMNMARNSADTMINKAIEVTYSMNDDTQMREIARAREERMFNERSVMKATENFGVQKGIFKVARNLITLGVELDKIIKATGLPESEIRQIQQEL
ncbi:MAG: Rpn family recombination-promoting nuclease/putative transposase [Ruminococcus sp.]|jgi:predicted transposase/invertase (TIGR01784 family)|nr:Rpn family recombination-promoting nuclease/putative transposase [Ruminococcus sp.]